MSNREKVIVLFSGGLDSSVLMHYVAKDLGKDILALYFDYGQLFKSKELASANSLVQDLISLHYNVGINVIPICKMYSLDSKSEYIPQRNLQFISRAAQIAEESDISKIYSAVIDPEKPEESRFPDTTPEFTNYINGALGLSGIHYITPFVDMKKWDIFCKARDYGIDILSTWSCNFPTFWQIASPFSLSDPAYLPPHKRPHELIECGKCGNCKTRDTFYNPLVAWGDCGMKPGELFKDVYMKSQLKEVRLAINNKCNMSCKHCFYGFKDTVRPDLSFSQYCKVIDDFVAMGVEQFHFSGKEPLYDDYIFKFTDYLKEKHPQIRYDVVTNGKNINKYIDKILDAGFYRINVSYDNSLTRDFDSSNVMKVLVKMGVEVNAFVTVSKSNVKEIESVLEHLYKRTGVKEFCVNVLHTSGKGKNLADYLLSSEEVYGLYKTLRDTDLPIHVLTMFKGSYVEDIIKNGHKDFEFDVSQIMKYGSTEIHDTLAFNPELFCARYYFNTTLTSDGYLLGCAVEVSKDYDKRSIGNVLDKPVEELVFEGKKRALSDLEMRMNCPELHECDICSGECLHENFCYKNMGYVGGYID